MSAEGEHIFDHCCQSILRPNALSVGDVLRADVDGHIFLTAYLSGTPECKFVLNDRSVSGPDVKGAGLCDYRFHQCVHLNEFDAKRAISFVPPDGEFQLMR